MKFSRGAGLVASLAPFVHRQKQKPAACQLWRHPHKSQTRGAGEGLHQSDPQRERHGIGHLHQTGDLNCPFSASLMSLQSIGFVFLAAVIGKNSPDHTVRTL